MISFWIVFLLRSIKMIVFCLTVKTIGFLLIASCKNSSLQVLVQVHHSLYKKSITRFSQHLTTKVDISKASCGVSMYITFHGKSNLPHDEQLVSVYKHLDDF